MAVLDPRDIATHSPERFQCRLARVVLIRASLKRFPIILMV